MIDDLFDNLVKEGYDFFVGVPDSALKKFQNDVINSGLPHIIATHGNRTQTYSPTTQDYGRNW